MDVARELSEYVAGAAAHDDLPDEVVRRARVHLLDTIAAGISGRALEAGQRGLAYVRHQAGPGGAMVWNSPHRVRVPFAALGNAMAAHADETDDTHAPSLTHPGCSVVPAAVATAEAGDRSGMELVRAIVLGYDVCGRVTTALWPHLFDSASSRVLSTHAIGGLFGSAASGALLRHFDVRRCRSLWSYAAQQASGLRTYFAEGGHVEKAFVFAGMPAFNGVLVAELVEAGWPGGLDPFTGEQNFFGLGRNAEPGALAAELGTRFEILRTKLKKYPVGSPVQAPVEALLSVLTRHDLKAEDVAAVRVWLAPLRLRTVQNRPIPDVNIEYLLDVALHDRALTFAAAHDGDRFEQWRSSHTDRRVQVLPDKRLGTSHAARIELQTTAGRTFESEVTAVPGTPEAPLTDAEAEAKAVALVEPALGPERTRRLLNVVARLPELPDISDLVEVLRER